MSPRSAPTGGDRFPGGDPDQPYRDSWEHLADEFALVDIRLRRRLSGSSTRWESPLDQLKGLVISEEEVAVLLSKPAARVSAAGSDDSFGAEVERIEAWIESRRRADGNAGLHLSLPHLSHLFQLSRLEEQCVVIALASEIDAKYDKLYAYLHDDVTRKKPTVGLVLTLLCADERERLAARAVFAPQAPLFRHRLLQWADSPADGPVPLLTRSLKLDDRIVDWLLGFRRQIDRRLDPIARLLEPEVALQVASAPAVPADRMREFIRSQRVREGQGNWVFRICGPAGVGKLALAGTAAHELGLPLLVADARRLPGDSSEIREATARLAREAFLQPAVLCIKHFEAMLEPKTEQATRLESLSEALATFGYLTFLLSEQPWQPERRFGQSRFVALDLALMGEAERANLWREMVGELELDGEIDAGALGGQYRFTPGRMRDALFEAQARAWWDAPSPGAVGRRHLYAACRAQSAPRLEGMARKIEPRATWDDIVLPEDPLVQLREICAQARCRHIVLGEWGFERKLSLGKGLSALFSGPPGTGKTMAAEVVAGDLGLDLYKIDLSQVVSKYIGETEKNLGRIFDAAQDSSAILFFDEADALFGKRSEVKDSHDRYANVEISYLLQKMEEYEGISILATNLRRNLDDAFVRRLQVIIEFPFPDVAFRERIWQVTFPPRTPLGEDVDFSILAREIRMAGGNIRNIGLTAAFYAAADGGMVRMEHLKRAARREHEKLGRAFQDRFWGRSERIREEAPSP